MSNLKRDFKGVWIPKDIWLDDKLSITEKFLLVEIDSLDQDERGCFASDLHLAGFLQKKEQTISNLLVSLRKRGYIKSDYNGLKRSLSVIRTQLNTTYRKKEVPLTENGKTTYRKREYSNTVSIYNNIIEKISSNIQLLEVIAMQNQIDIEIVKSKIEEFVKYTSAVGNPYNNDTELFSHFSNWIKAQKIRKRNADVEVNWFIKQFNARCKGEFVATSNVKGLFVVQLENGFTGDQMKKAINNLFSSDDKNKFHKESNFKFATPSYLLKDDNLNKYLNQRF